MKQYIWALFLLTCNAEEDWQQRRFPDQFLFGAGTSAYQIEGAWNTDGKGENIWDHITHFSPHVITGKANGDVAADSYHQYKRDVQMIRELGLDVYRFSISWARILPDGLRHNVNQAGVAFYNNLIDELLRYNIKPIVTLYHYDLPQKLQELGGFVNPLLSDWFEDYASLAFELFGDRVKTWFTFNEPREICYEGYGTTLKAPALNNSLVALYLCAKTLVMAHAKAYHAYNDHFKKKQGGECGIIISVNNYISPNNDRDNQILAELRRQAEWGIYADPIFSETGGFPKEFSDFVAKLSLEQGYPRSRLPAFTETEMNFVKGSADIFGVNHYLTAYILKQYNTTMAVEKVKDDVGGYFGVPLEWPGSRNGKVRFEPNSLYSAMKQLHRKYGNVRILLTESGWPTDSPGPLDDDSRVTYYRAVLNGVLDALHDGINIEGFLAWSLMDNFEWFFGYSLRFGLYAVDFENITRPRVPRKSAFIYKKIIKTRVIDPCYEPNNYIMTID